jgi:hypothetical protein
MYSSAEKEKESRIKLDALKVQMQFIAEYGRHLLNLGVRNKLKSQIEKYTIIDGIIF